MERAVDLGPLEDIRWRTMVSGNWDDSPNWTVSTQPGRVHNVSIDPEISLSVSGPAADVTVRSLVIGDSGGVGQPTLNLQAGTILNAAIGLVVHSNATVNFEIGGTDPADFAQLRAADGVATLNGTLAVSLVDQGSGLFVPSAGDTFMILSAEDGIFSQFTEQQLPAVAGGTGLTWQVHYNANNVTLEVLSTLVGDYNGNGVVDAADYVVWRKTDGTPAGYNAWRTHFGQTAATSAAQAAVPEPDTAGLVLVGLLGMVRRRTRGRHPC